MTKDDQAALAALGRKMARTNGYTAMQSSSLYVTDGDEIDWAYGHEHIFMYTFELYPSHSVVSSTARFYPRDELIGPQTERNKAAILLLLEAAAARTARLARARPTAGHCTTASRPSTAGSPTRSGPTPRPVALGSVPTRPPRPGRPAPSHPDPRRWSPAPRPGRASARTTSTAV